MECYNHAGKVSVTLCKICHKGLCRDCSQFVGKSFVCSETCGEQLVLLEQIQEWSSRYVTKKNRSLYSPLIFMIMGFAVLLPLIYDYFMYGDKLSYAYSTIIFGISMFVIAIISYKSMPK
jgi:hypothetical protein